MSSAGRRPRSREHSRVDPARQLAQLRQGLRELLSRAREHLRRPGRVGRELRLDQAQCHRQRHEALLRAVVQIPLEHPPRAILGPHEAGTRGVQVLGDPLPLRDVDAGDEEEPSLVDLGQRCARPGDGQSDDRPSSPTCCRAPSAARRRRRPRRAPAPRPPRTGRRSSPRGLARRSGPARTRACARTRCSRRPP